MLDVWTAEVSLGIKMTMFMFSSVFGIMIMLEKSADEVSDIGLCLILR